MNKRNVRTVFLSFLLLLGASVALAGQTVYDGGRKPEMLWVQSARSMTYVGGFLTLEGVPSTTYFSDRPARLYGHMGNAAYADEVVEEQQADPPNAAVSILGSEEVVVVELLGKPAVANEGNTVTWKVRLLSGTLPAKAGPVSLFIDPMCQPQITD